MRVLLSEIVVLDEVNYGWNEVLPRLSERLAVRQEIRDEKISRAEMPRLRGSRGETKTWS